MTVDAFGWPHEQLSEVLIDQPNGKPIQQGWSPQCLSNPAGDDAWGVLKTTAIQPGWFDDSSHKELPSGLSPRPNIEVRSGDLLITCAGPRARCGVPALVRSTRARLMMSGKMYRLRPNPTVDPRFLEQWLLSPDAQRRIDKMKTGISDSGLNLTHGRFLQLPVPVPPVAEQRRVVAILEEHLTDLDSAGRSLRSAAARVGMQRKSLVDGLASGALMGPIAAEGLANGWLWRTPAQLATQERGGIVIGPFGSDLKTSDYREQGIPLVFVRNVRSADFGPARTRFISSDKAVELASHDARFGDVLITKMGDPPGDSAVYDQAHGIITADVIRVRPGIETDSKYLAAAVSSSLVRRQVLAVTSGVAQKKVSLARFRSSVKIPAPGLEMQQSIMRMVEPQFHSISRLQAALAEAERRSSALRRALLAAAFSGRLTGRSSDTEVIEELAEEASA